MLYKITRMSALLDIALVASLVAAIVVMGNREALSSPLYFVLVAGLLVTVTVLGWWREAQRESKLDELELAAASFGARWSIAVVGIVAFLILFITPIQQGIVWFAAAYEANEGRPLPAAVGVFVCGFVLAQVVSLTAKSVIGAIWTWTKR